MLVIGFIQWWYGPGWREAGQGILNRIRSTYLNFSIPILLRTMFEPWRRIVSPSQGSLGMKMRAALDNLVSRFVGFGVRLCALLAALVLIVLNLIIGGIIFVLWPLLPLLSILMVAGGFVG
jgi:hypothetical protein